MTRKAGHRGISLVELLVSAALLGYLFYSIFRLLEPGLRVWRQSDVRVTLQQCTLLAMYRLTGELKESNRNTVTLKKYDPVIYRVSTLICFASNRDRQGNPVYKMDKFETGPAFYTGEPDWQKYVIYYLDNSSRLRRYETAIIPDSVPAPTPPLLHPNGYRNADDMLLNKDPLSLINVSNLISDPVIARNINDLKIEYTPPAIEWGGGVTIFITALHPDPNPAEQFQMSLETTVRVRYDEKDF